MGRRCDVSVRFHEPPPDLSGFFTTFYQFSADCPDGPVDDALHPEWGGLRFFNQAGVVSSIADGAEIGGTTFTAMGPSSVPVNFRMVTTRMWGIGLMPLGWATFMGQPAYAMANRLFDGHTEPAFASFAPLTGRLSHDPDHSDADLALIVDFFRHQAPRHGADAERIMAVQTVLLDPELPDVAEMAARAGLHPRTLERLCRKSFGFAPKILLRRQRFMRSLAQFMLDPSLKWVGAIDALYFDQSHFVRDCKEFLGMTPSEYAARDHPILSAVMRARMAAVGAAVQTLGRKN